MEWVHPKVLENVGINPKEYQRFAFGLGARPFCNAKIRYQRFKAVFEGDIRWLNHYNFAALDIPTLAGGLTR